MDGRYAKTFTVVGQYGPGRIGAGRSAGTGPKRASRRRRGPRLSSPGRIHIDNWRWSGVPFYLRTGKRLPRRESEIYIEFKLPLRLFGKACGLMEANGLVPSIQPRERISLVLTVKHPGMGSQPAPARMVFDYAESFRVKSAPSTSASSPFASGRPDALPRQDEEDATWTRHRPRDRIQGGASTGPSAQLCGRRLGGRRKRSSSWPGRGPRMEVVLR